jgi:hypothetical protein
MRAEPRAGSMAGERLRLHRATAAGLEQVMGIGVGISLLVIGGVAAFGIRDQWSAVDLTAIGYICMGVGALAIILALVMNNQRSRTAHTEYIEHRDVGGPPVT